MSMLPRRALGLCPRPSPAHTNPDGALQWNDVGKPHRTDGVRSIFVDERRILGPCRGRVIALRTLAACVRCRNSPHRMHGPHRHQQPLYRRPSRPSARTTPQATGAAHISTLTARRPPLDRSLFFTLAHNARKASRASPAPRRHAGPRARSDIRTTVARRRTRGSVGRAPVLRAGSYCRCTDPPRPLKPTGPASSLQCAIEQKTCHSGRIWRPESRRISMFFLEKLL
jgi:hypothetical protein